MTNKKHSILAPSAATRWLSCPPSAQLAAKYGEETKSEFAAEGHLAHRIAELWLLNEKHVRAAGRQLVSSVKDFEAAKKDPLFYEGMLAEIRIYTDYVIRILNESGKGASFYVEQKLPLFYRSEDRGTVDAVVLSPATKTLHIIDLKFGKGVQVNAENNKQLLIYGICAYDAFKTLCEIETVTMHIVQPRRDSISSWTRDVADFEFEQEYIETIAEKAIKGEGELSEGNHCKFCPVKAQCRRLKDMADTLPIEQYPSMLTGDEIAEVLRKSDIITDYLEAVKKFALKKAIDGEKFTGYKLVSGVSHRKITDQAGMLSALVSAGYDEPLFLRSTFVTLRELQKIVPKVDFVEYCDPYITKPEAPPALVPECDPRPEYGVAKAVTDFAEYINPQK